MGGGAASATTSFDPTTAEQTFDETHTVCQDLDGLPVWDRTERHVDGDTVLFQNAVLDQSDVT